MTDVELYRLLGRIEVRLGALEDRLAALDARLRSEPPSVAPAPPSPAGPGLHLAYGGARVSASLSRAGALLAALIVAHALGFLTELIELLSLLSASPLMR